VAIFGVDYKDEPEKAKQWLAEKGNPYRAVIDDRAGRLGLDLGVTGAPETYVVDHRGVVRFRYQGALDERVWRDHVGPVVTQLREEAAASGS
jgi:cytochrome c biogenesis protein CcmG/thiol:disulfide interchange protein DsbE